MSTNSSLRPLKGILVSCDYLRTRMRILVLIPYCCRSGVTELLRFVLYRGVCDIYLYELGSEGNGLLLRHQHTCESKHLFHDIN